MPVVLCQNERRNSAGEKRRCRKALGDLPPQMLTYLKSHEGVKLTYRCPVCKWVSVEYRDGKLTFDGMAPKPDFNRALVFDEATVCTQIA